MIRLLVAISSVCAMLATAAERPVAEIVDFGIYTGGHDQAIVDTNAPTGEVLLGGMLKLVKQTTEIPAQLGRQFGFHFVIHGKKEDGAIALHVVYLFPEMSSSVPRKKTGRFDANVHGLPEDKTAGVFWTFTEPSELVAGQWTFQVFRGEEKILEKKFDVEIPGKK